MDHFLVVWQTGSGTQSNMNANEDWWRANEILTGRRGAEPGHPNDHRNMGQSSNDTFRLSAHRLGRDADQNNLPQLRRLVRGLAEKAEAFASIIKIGVPI